MIQKFKRGQIFYYDFGDPNNRNGSIENKTRPCLIVSNDMNNSNSSILTVVPITTREKSECKHWQVFFEYNSRPQVILCDQIRVINADRIKGYYGTLDEVTMKKVNIALATQLDLNISDKELNQCEFIERLDKSIDKILHNKLDIQTNQINKVIDIINENQKVQKEMIQSFIKNIPSDYSTLNNNINSIKEVFNKNSNNIEKIINSLITLYNNIDDSYNGLINVNNSNYEDKNNSKCDDNNINQVNIKNNSDNLDKNSINNLDENKVDKSEEVIESSNIDDNKKHKNSFANRRLSGWQPKINYDDIEGCLNFLQECNEHSTNEICEKYNITKKQLSNRKYLIRNSLIKRNIEFTIVDKRGRKKGV